MCVRVEGTWGGDPCTLPSKEEIWKTKFNRPQLAIVSSNSETHFKYPSSRLIKWAYQMSQNSKKKSLSSHGTTIRWISSQLRRTILSSLEILCLALRMPKKIQYIISHEPVAISDAGSNYALLPSNYADNDRWSKLKTAIKAFATSNDDTGASSHIR